VLVGTKEPEAIVSLLVSTSTAFPFPFPFPFLFDNEVGGNDGSGE
jgi:hypothetical protein